MQKKFYKKAIVTLLNDTDDMDLIFLIYGLLKGGVKSGINRN